MIHKISIKFPEEFTITSVTTNKSDLNVTLKKNYVPKDGDIIFSNCKVNLTGYVSIFKETKDNQLITYCDFALRFKTFSVPMLNSFLRNFSDTIELRLATKQEKAILFDNIKKEGLNWNPETKTLEEIYVPKDGDIVYTKGNRMQFKTKVFSSIGIFKEIKDNMIYCHCEFFLENHFIIKNPYPLSLIHNQIIRPATDYEMKILSEHMTDSNLSFDYENKKLIKTYQPKDGDFVFNQAGSDSIIIFKKIIENKVSAYCSLFNKSNNLFITRNDYFTDISNFKPRLATEEEKETLVNKLKEIGLEWNAETKTLEEIYLPKVGDICIAWSYKSHAIIGKVIYIDNHVYSVGGEKYENCIKYESMEQYQEILNDKK